MKRNDATALMLICKGKFEENRVGDGSFRTMFEDNKSLKIILTDSALNDKDIICILSSKDDNGWTIMHYVCCYGKDSKKACQIIEYFANQKDLKTLETLLAMKTKSDGDTCLIKAVKHSKLDFIKTVFKVINNKTLSNILSMKNNKFETAFDIARMMGTTQSYDQQDELNYNNKYEIEELIESILEYLKFDTLLDLKNKNQIDVIGFNEYGTNPFITCCQYGKVETIKKLLNYIKGIDDDENIKLKTLLLNNYDIIKLKNGLMIAFENGYNEIITEIFNNITNLKVKIELLSQKNWIGDDKHLDRICEIVDSINSDEKIVKSSNMF